MRAGAGAAGSTGTHTRRFLMRTTFLILPWRFTFLITFFFFHFQTQEVVGAAGPAAADPAGARARVASRKARRTGVARLTPAPAEDAPAWRRPGLSAPRPARAIAPEVS